MISLTDSQLTIVTNVARDLPVEKRTTYLQRIAAALRRYDNRYIPDTAVADAASKALAGLVQQPAA